jgi:hypothetical protein
MGGSLAHPAHLDYGGPYQLALLALVSHTAPPHGSGHPIELQVNGGPVPEEGTHELRIVCTQPGCDRLGGSEATYRVDAALTGACAIAFHAVHEGHALVLFWDGKQIHPPC